MKKIEFRYIDLNKYNFLINRIKKVNKKRKNKMFINISTNINTNNEYWFVRIHCKCIFELYKNII